MSDPEGKPSVHSTSDRPDDHSTTVDKAEEFLADQPPIGQIDPQVEKRLLWKIDLVLMPLMCVTFGLQYYDKQVLSSASIFGVLKDMDLTRTYGNPPVTSTVRYSTATAAFYWGYMAATLPMTWILQKFPLGRTLAIMVLLWGMIVLTTISIHSYPAIVTQRVFLGAIESSVSPGFVLLTSAWYKKSEQPIRLGFWYSATGLFSIFSGVVNYGLGKAAEGSSLATWKAMYIFAGTWTVLWGLILLFFLPDNPMTARFLTIEERRIAVERLRSNMTGIENKEFKVYQFMEGLCDIKLYLFLLMGAALYITNGGLTAFGAIIVKSFGYSSLQTILLLTPGGATTVVSIWITSFIASRFKNTTTLLLPLSCLPVLAGAITLWKYDWSHRGPLLVGYYLLGIFGAPYVLLLSISTANVAGYTKKALSSGFIFIGYNVGNIVAPYLVNTTERAIHFRTTWISIIVAMVFSIICSLLLRAIMQMENVKRDRDTAPTSNQSTEQAEKAEHRGGFQGDSHQTAEEGRLAFKDLTDGENSAFRYSL
ncbi:hypothetical protein FRC02_000782 [Tulasnella sp. 418]|nr:hypothetical protein FRC02_000782 [Tulasnella sp. 418]